jgi:hypothetical protein
MKRILIITLALGGLTTCGTTEEVESTPLEVQQLGPSDGVDHPEIEVPPTSAKIKRLLVDQIIDSLPVVAGQKKNGEDMNWVISIEELGKTYDAFLLLARTLGKPDFVEVTQQNREPSALYIKFMGDMALDVCDSVVEADAVQSDPEDRVLTRFIVSEPATDQEINDNLRYLTLRFFGHRVADDDDESLADLRGVYSAAFDEAPGGTDNKASLGWHAVCVALLTSPSFHLY